MPSRPESMRVVGEDLTTWSVPTSEARGAFQGRSKQLQYARAPFSKERREIEYPEKPKKEHKHRSNQRRAARKGRSEFLKWLFVSWRVQGPLVEADACFLCPTSPEEKRPRPPNRVRSSFGR